MKLTDDDFALFGLPARQALDRSALDARRRELQAQVHPDRHAAAGASAQRLAMQWAVRVNEAYRRLKDPVARAMALCELAGVHVDVHDNAAMPGEFLVQQMQWREDLAQTQDPQAIRRLEGEVQARLKALEEQLQVELDERDDAQAAAQTVRALMFVARFRADVDQRLEAQES